MGNYTLVLFLLLSVICGFATQVHFVLVNDCHAVMESWGYRDDVTLEANLGGYPRAVHIIDSLVGENPDMLFLHAGDILTGDFLSPMTDGRAIWHLWKEAGVEAFAVGNHEFEYGPGILDTALGRIDVPLVCANLDATGYPNLAASIEPYRMFDFPGESLDDTIRIAVFGACTEETDDAGWTDPLDLGNAVTGIDTFGLPPEADAAIALTHLDISVDYDVAEISFIDAVLGGHNHYVGDDVQWAISGTDSTPVVKAGPNIIRVGHLTMDYEPGEGLSFVAWDNIPIGSGVPEDSAARALLNEYRDTVTHNPAVGLDPYATVAFYADSNISASANGPVGSVWLDSPEGNLVTEAYRACLATDIGVEGRGALRMNIFSGPVTYADLFRAVPAGRHPTKGLNSRLINVRVTGAQLKTMVEYALFGSGISTEAFPEFSGMRLEYNPEGSLFNRISVDTWFIRDTLWSATDTYSVAGTELLEYAIALVGVPIEEIIVSDTTVWEALVAYCTDPAFEPVYRSDGRLRDITAGIEQYASLPANIAVRAYPNPFNSSIRIETDDIPVNIEIFDIRGRIVANIPANNFVGADFTPACDDIAGNAEQDDARPSPTEVVWQPDESLPSGVYLVRAKIAGKSVSKRVVYLK